MRKRSKLEVLYKDYGPGSPKSITTYGFVPLEKMTRTDLITALNQQIQQYIWRGEQYKKDLENYGIFWNKEKP